MHHLLLSRSSGSATAGAVGVPASSARRDCRGQSGFTLLEALVAISLLMTLSVIAISHLWRARLRANEASAVVSLRLIHTAEQTYSNTYEVGYSDTQLCSARSTCWLATGSPEGVARPGSRSMT